ncbi:bifunctional phosphopantothenoylcysteine decarboxylase/phosphopantothenate--cysteine ligase CoaBC [Salinimonas marina]|uniref:Coenzyme A biosynthesis bifunctional protein CoaBC n=1 Tax=Salinimonas marina TaxID=2785918 RepID=A0A7S9DXD2_9ALTE|nr:bifunctional phosphopantothenoylcysteine decarboxylase/phosphopantothenate--cysteine ligase CoaBC [Salinimonas marina]QPG05709.1 bifunctional phosphopantothenoylcysteine decarboxylase/phosphopantothenate--cysteine ligase CoaBC [Salinimonas marina]
MQLHNKKILLGISGGIAAYKTPDLVRKLTAEGAIVKVVVTASAKEFVSPLSLQAVSGEQVHDSLLDPAAEAAMGHIELAKWADILLIAPATANIMAKLATGLADDLLTTLCLATSAPIVVAPAMNQQMWKATATVHNRSVLAARGVEFVGPASGAQACGDTGYGRMSEPEEIVQYLKNSAPGPALPDLSGKTILITAGPTQEALDPVRYLSNHSSGKMGYALAQVAAQANAKVILVSGPTNLGVAPGITKIPVTSAAQMLSEVMQQVQQCDIFIATAAVADYRPATVADNKIKKKDDELTLTFVKNPDILKQVANLPTPPFTVGFAAESQNVEHYARSKLNLKKLDMIAANNIATAGLGFNSDHNALHVIWRDGEHHLPPQPKVQLAAELLSLVATQFNKKTSN